MSNKLTKTAVGSAVTINHYGAKLRLIKAAIHRETKTQVIVKLGPLAELKFKKSDGTQIKKNKTTYGASRIYDFDQKEWDWYQNQITKSSDS